MKHWKTIAITALLAGAFSAQIATADITATQAWDAMTTISKSYGKAITGTPSMSGDTLTVKDAAFSFDLAQAKIAGKIGDVTLKEMGDGTVEVTLPTDYPFNISVRPKGAKQVDLAMMAHQSAMKLLISGSPSDTTYDYASDELTISIVSLTIDGKPFDAKLMMTMSKLAGKYGIVDNGALKGITSALTVANVGVTLNLAPPKDQGHLDMTLSIANIKSASQSSVPVKIDYSDMQAMLAAGMTVDGSVSYGAVNLAMNFKDNADTATTDSAVAGGSLNFAMSRDSLSYGTTSQGLDVTFAASGLPLPQINFQIANTAFNLKMPIVKSDQPADIALLTSLKGVTISDMIWGIFDPTAQLPRDPANIVLDVSGKAKWLFNLFDPKAAEALQGPPGELTALDINALELSVAGASLTGNGAFTFDNTDMTTFDGIPKPTGAANLKLVGGNGLMDKLVAMGILPQDQVMGFKMMLGLFAAPGEGEDTLVSELSVAEDGSILANGQRIK